MKIEIVKSLRRLKYVSIVCPRKANKPIRMVRRLIVALRHRAKIVMFLSYSGGASGANWIVSKKPLRFAIVN